MPEKVNMAAGRGALPGPKRDLDDKTWGHPLGSQRGVDDKT